MANYMAAVGHLGIGDNPEYHFMPREYVNSKGHSSGHGVSSGHMSQYAQPPLNLNTLSSINASSTGSTNSATSSSSSTNCQSQGQPPNSPSVLLPPGRMGTQVIHIIHSNRGNKSQRPSASDVDDVLDEHDYYNDDFTRFQPELQPLNHRRNETTV